MAITSRYTLLCDDVRREDNGKFIILGLYTPDIIVPSVPFGLPSLCFFTVIEHTASTGAYEFNFTLKQGDTVLAGGSGKMGVSSAGLAALPLRLGQVLLPIAGLYVFTLSIAGIGEVTHEFSVTLRVRGDMGQPAPRGVH